MARNTRPTSDQFDYTVEQSPLYDRHSKPVKVGGSPIFGNFRTDNNVCLGTSTEAYEIVNNADVCLLYTSPSPRDATLSRMPSSA